MKVLLKKIFKPELIEKLRLFIFRVRTCRVIVLLRSISAYLYFVLIFPWQVLFFYQLVKIFCLEVKALRNYQFWDLPKLGCLTPRLINFYVEIHRRSSLDVFNYQTLARPLKMVVVDEYDWSGLNYGALDAFRLYSGYKGRINAYIEHGVYFGSYVMKLERHAAGIISFGDYRYEALQGLSGKRISLVGPYIHYVSSYYPELELKRIKEALGKTLLVFPMHTIQELSFQYEIDDFIRHVQDLQQQYHFDSVVVCMFWWNVLSTPEMLEKYQQAGFKIATCGHPFDFNFLSRLRSLILLADMTISNGLGTHIGYCVYLNKPHHLYAQKIQNIKGGEKQYFCAAYMARTQQELQGFVRMFGEYKEALSLEQREFCNYYWGFEHVKTPDQLKGVLQSLACF